jgi:hypothetical protein
MGVGVVTGQDAARTTGIQAAGDDDEELVQTVHRGRDEDGLPLARVPRDQSPLDGSPGLFAACRALEPPGAKTSPTRPY